MSDVDAQKAIAAGWSKPVPVGYTKRDAILYAIGTGANELPFIYENDDKFSVFPWYPVVLPFKGNSHELVSFPSDTMADLGGHAEGQPSPAGAVLDGERQVDLLNTLPVEGKDLFMKQRIIAITDRKSGATVETETILFGGNGTEYVRLIGASFFVGVTGFQSAGKSNSQKVKVPKRAPDKVIEQKTTKEQAQLYRLSGDYNPLHVDPSMAGAFGFKAPILHGLCSFGFSARHVLQAYGDNDTTTFKSIKVRFSSPVYPGETLVTQMWEEGGKIIFQTLVKERNKVCMSQCWAELKKGGASAGSSASAAASAGPSYKSDVVFKELGARVDAAAVKKVKATFAFHIKGASGVKKWFVDLKSGSGSVTQEDKKADCTVILSDDDMVKMAGGNLNAQQAFMQGKLKLKGNMMLAQKLGGVLAKAKSNL